MDSDRFDALSRLLATPMPRRGSLGLLASALAGALLPGLVPRRAQSLSCEEAGGYLCHGSCSGCTTTCCPTLDWQCCVDALGREGCCDPTGAQSGMFCDPTLGCVNSCPENMSCGRTCCRSDELCDSMTATCVPACAQGLLFCPGSGCVDPNTDLHNCGGCGFNCNEINKHGCRQGHCTDCLTAADCGDNLCAFCQDGSCVDQCPGQTCCIEIISSKEGFLWCCPPDEVCGNHSGQCKKMKKH